VLYHLLASHEIYRGKRVMTNSYSDVDKSTAADSSNEAVVDFGSVYTENFPDVLKQLGISIAVSTYQAGKIILLREDKGELNTHFKIFSKPMGIASQHGRLCIGTQNEVREYHNVPAVSGKLTPANKHDAVYAPRRKHVTGNVDIHEMSFDGNGELWFVNTRFSCLSTLDLFHSFTPRWHPPFISSFAPEDRCHLNGLAMRDGQPRYVTMLGQTDIIGGWRDNKKDGGLLMDIRDNRVISSGLSMPHSPRWHDEKLWVLESGQGSLCRVDEQTGSITTVATMPGFTRGIDFHQGLAFIGLSQVRESALFSGLPLTEKPDERHCGIWVVELETGKTLAFLRFEGAVQEIFSVQVMAGSRFPELLEDDDPLVNTTYVLPDESLQKVDGHNIRNNEEKVKRAGSNHGTTQSAPTSILPTGY
jgi:uncharacterized protein (TIGR03032 family)